MTKDTYVENIARTFWKNVDALRQFHQLSWVEVCGDGTSSTGFRNNTPPTLAKMARIAERLHTTVPELLNDSMLPEPTEDLFIATLGEWTLVKLNNNQAAFTKNWANESLMFFRDIQVACEVAKEFPEAQVELWS
ncbi:hypothetical protein EC99P1_00039 [Enterococcus phage EC99P1]|nr:hypothetical protein EC99P1_00039 [Enterococcus phage EC99P1]